MSVAQKVKQAGKGSQPRPYKPKLYAFNYELIRWKSKCTCKINKCKSNSCKGECGCKKCYNDYQDFLSGE